MRIVALDFETANNHSQSACALGITVFEEGELVEEYNFLIRPHEKYRHFAMRNIEIHGISPEMVEDEKEWDEVYQEIQHLFLDAYIVAHNASFDIAVFKSLQYLYHISFQTFPYFCTVELARKLYPNLRNHKLNTVCEYMGIELNHHEASSDARACALIVQKSMMLLGEYEITSFLKTVSLKTYIC